MQAPNGNGAMPMPVGGPQQRMPPYQMMPGEMNGMGMLGMARSPPKNKSEFAHQQQNQRKGQNSRRGGTGLSKRADTSHVPCKFFLSSQCQAGRMCPFSHDIESTTKPMPCKYFAKGHCKFGAKCALLHITPDGTVVNRRMGPPQQMYGGGMQAQAGAYAQPPPGLLSMQAMEQRPNGDGLPDEIANYQYGAKNGTGFDMPHFDYTSASPKFGSPPQNQNEHFGSPPNQKGLSVLDAPLPNSFDSNGVSMAARNGPFAASVPSRFGIESPPASLPKKSQLGNTALQDLHNSAFGGRGNLDSVLAGSSPPSGTSEPMTFPKRPLHSQRLRASQQMISSSVGTRLPTQSFEYSDEEDGDTDREEDLLPASLHDLIPEGRSRRESRGQREDDSPASFLAAQRRTLSSTTTTGEGKVGSPSYSSSPSRYNGMFSQQRSNSSDFIGSPLRNSGFSIAPTSAPRTSNGELSPSLSSPPRQASMSMLTQELQRTKLDAARSQAAHGTNGATPIMPPGPTRTLSNGSSGRKSLDRAMSSNSVGRERIDEEQELFDMDEVTGPARSAPRPIAPIGSPKEDSIGSRLYGSPNGNELGPIGGQRGGK